MDCSFIFACRKCTVFLLFYILFQPEKNIDKLAENTVVIAVNVADPPDQEDYPASEADASLNLNRNTSHLSYTGNETRDGIAKVRLENRNRNE